MAASPFVHHLADYHGVSTARASDAALLSGLLIAAAGAAGLGATATPTVHLHPSGNISVTLLLDGGHVALHSYPQRTLVLAEVLVPAGMDGRKALDVLARRLAPTDTKQASRERGVV